MCMGVGRIRVGAERPVGKLLKEMVVAQVEW